MKYAIVGYGGIGKAIDNMAIQRQHQNVAIIDQNDHWDLSDAEVVFESTNPKVCVENLRKLCQAGKNIIVVTTSWYEYLPEITQLAEENQVRILWSSNFSIGVNVYYQIIEAASKIMNKVNEYDIWGTEIHHRNKLDSPSGTAKKIEEIILHNIDRKTAVIEDKLDRRLEPHEFHFSSTRGGEVNFSHTLSFDSPADCIEIKHSARNRDGYALGAVQAAEWLLKQSVGVYTMEDFLHSILNK